MLIKLADLYEISVDYLLGHTPDKDMPEDIKELVDKYNHLSNEGRLRIDNQIDCELRVDALAAEKRLLQLIGTTHITSGNLVISLLMMLLEN